MSAPRVSVLKLSFSAVFVVLTLALAGFAVVALRMRCEGFGCIGVGVAWAAWAAVFLPAVVAGVALRACLPAATRVRAIVTWSLAALLALGTALALYWLALRLA